MSECKNQLAALIFHYQEKDESLNKSCQIIANRLDNEWSWEYIKQIHISSRNPGKYLVRAIDKLHYIIFTKRPRFRVHVDAKDQKTKDRWLQLSPDKRAAALNRACVLENYEVR